jgi:hypothetical protein
MHNLGGSLIIYHRLRAKAGFLSGLKQQNYSPSHRPFRQSERNPHHYAHVSVMTTKMAFSVDFRAIGERRFFCDWQSVEFAADQHGWPRLCAAKLGCDTVTT